MLYGEMVTVNSEIRAGQTNVNEQNVQLMNVKLYSK